MRRPLGCMTFSALIAAVLTMGAILIGIAATGNTMFSPGPLNAETQAAPGTSLGGTTSHAGLEGRCDACHAPIWSGQTMNERCVACHTQVGQDIAEKAGLHGRLGAVASDCRVCHTDHHGATASLTRADPSVFPHDETGFALTAHHESITGGSVTCRSCHPGSPVDYRNTSCLTCHQQLDAAKMGEHTAAYGTVCLDCHDGKDTYGKSFAHTTYPLVGKHESASCGGCHQGATSLTALRATPTGCAACHAGDDIHEGRLGTSCESCHTPAGWSDATIDHAKTGFELTGKHVGVACESCHVDRKWTGIGTTCSSCHAKDDPHDGRFGTDCASCHSTSGWTDVTFDHSVTGFPLASGHADVACASCHQGGRYAGTPTACVACHAADDEHDGALGTGCAACHQATVWSDGRFDHSAVRFKLTGAHLGPACERCHTKPPPSATPTLCASCHTKPATHTAAFAGSCDACHTTGAWTPATFDHGRTSFKLTGAHANLTCARCHKLGSFTGLLTSCASCHAKPASHTAAFAGACSTCHTTTAWTPASFDHGTTSFKLTGAHTSLACARCHKGSTFSGLPTTCVGCHAKPSSHPASYGTNCTLCHTTKAWLPISYKGAHSFPMSHGGAGGRCATCHLSSLTTYTCTKCHSSSIMAEHHKEVAGYSSTNCIKCHPKGAKED